MRNNGLIITLLAGAAIAKHRIVKHGSDDHHAIQAAGSTDGMFGVSAELDVTAEEQVDIVMDGIAEVEYGGNVTRGDLLTADADGKAVAAAPAAGANARIIGIAMVSGVAGDIGAVNISPGRIQG